MREIAISAGHGKLIRGASDIIDEVEEARDVCEQVASDLRTLGVKVHGPYFDDVSVSQNENLERICEWHNAQSSSRQLDVSVHFNAYEHTEKPMGTEVWFISQSQLAAAISLAIADAADLIDRGDKYSDSLYFLNHTSKPAVLLEICFVDSVSDVDAYEGRYRDICFAIARTIAHWGEEDVPIATAPGKDIRSARGDPRSSGRDDDEDDEDDGDADEKA